VTGATEEPRYQGLEIVRLRRERDGVAAGCCGIVWGVYGPSPWTYEACFINQLGESEDATFEASDVDSVADISEAPAPRELLEILRTLEGAAR